MTRDIDAIEDDTDDEDWDDDDCDDDWHIIGSCQRCGCNLYDDECDDTETYCDSCHWWMENS